MAITEKSLKEFVDRANKGSIPDEKKGRWHRLGQGLAKTLAEKMGLSARDCRIISRKGGPGCESGEIILHADWVYIQFGISCFGGETRFTYRTCDGLWDFTGGINRFMEFDELLDLDKVAEKIMECRGEV